MKKHLLTKTLLFLAFLIWTQVGWGQLIISQYIETGSGTTPKGIEIWNKTGATVDFSVDNLIIKQGTNGAAPSTVVTISSGTLASEAVCVVGTNADVSGTGTGFKDFVEGNSSSFYTFTFTFNGDDALEIWLGGTKQDVFGDPGTGDPGTGWAGSGVQTYNQNISIKSSINTADNDGWTDPSLRFETTTIDNSLTGFGIAPLDVFEPIWTSTYPKTNNVETTTLDLVYNMDESGTAYYVVLADGATAPTSAQVKAGTDASDTPVALSGSKAIAAASTDYTSNITGLTESTAYDIYVVAQDDEGTPNVQADPVLVDITTIAPDVTAPTWTATYPKITDITKTTAILKVNIDEPGKAYYQVLADGSAAPTSATVIAAANEIVIAAGTTEYTANLSGLTQNTPYDVYVVAQDDEGTPNVQADPTLVEFTSAALNTETEFTVFSFAEETGPATITTGVTGTIEIDIAGGSTINNLVATFALSSGASAKIGAVDQVSGTTANDFSSDVTYTVTAEDGTTTKDWVVTVTMPSPDATVSSVVYTVDNGLETIADVPFNTTLAIFKSNITPATGATFEVYEADGSTVATNLADGYKLICTAEDLIATKTYTINLLSAPTGDLFISEYIEGSSSNKAIEIYNGTGVTLDLGTYTVNLAGNGGAWGGTPQALSGILLDGEVYVIANSSSIAAILAQADITSTVTFYNGDDAVGLFNNSVLIDAVGQQGVDPGTAWPVAGITNATAEHTIIRKAAITAGNTDWTVSAGTNETDSEWEVYPQNYYGGLGSHNQPKLSAEANITGFDVTGQVGDETINTTAFTVNLGVTAATVLTALEPTVAVSTGATVSPVSGLAQDFTTSKIYTVTAEGGNSQAWNVTIVNLSNVATLSDLKVDGTTVADFTSTTYDYVVVLPYGTTVTPPVTVTENSNATSAIVPATDITSGTAADRTTVITVTSQDNTVTQDYTVLFNVTPPSTDATLSDLKIDGTTVTGFVSTTYDYIVDLPFGTTATPVVTVTETDANASSVIVAATDVTSATAADRTTTVTVTAEDGTTTQDYTVLFNVTPPQTGKDILTYSFSEQTGPATIGDGTIDIEVAALTDRSNLIATFTISDGATVAVGATPQVSGTTANDFTNPVTYTVTAEDSNTKDWVVTVTNSVILSDATEILTFSVLGVDATVNSADSTVTVTLPYGTDRSSLVATYTLSTGATAKVGLVAQVSGTTANDFTNPVVYTITAEDATTTQDWEVTVNLVAPSTDATLSDLKVDGTTVAGFVSTTFDYIVELPFGTTATPVVTYTETDANASSVIVDATDITSATAADRTTTVTVTAEDGTTTQDYTVLFNVNPGSDDATVTSTVYNVNNAYNVINMVANGTTLVDFEANLTPAVGATFETYEGDSITPATDLEDGYIVIVTAQNGSTTKIYTVFIETASGASDLFFSEYVEGSSNNKALEIYNGTGASVDLSNYVIRINANGSAWTSFFDFPAGTNLANGDVYVIAHAEASAEILAVTDTAIINPYSGGTSYVAVFNGDDVRGLFKVSGIDTTLIDIIGNYNMVDPGTGWDVAGIANATGEHTLIRKVSVTQGNIDWTASAGTTTEDSEWEVNDQNYVDNLGTHGASVTPEVEILSFELAEQYSEAVFDSTAGTIDIAVLFGTNVTDLVPTIEISEGAFIMPESGVSQDFTAPVVYTVTGSDYMTTKDWTVTVTVNPTASDDAEIITFEIADMDSSVINLTDTTITVYMPYGTDAAALTPAFTISTGATVDFASGTVQNFTSPFTYTVTAQNTTNAMAWEVTVNVVEAAEVTIHDIQYTEATPANSPYDGQLIKTKGIVTASYTSGFYIQDGTDEWSAVYVYNNTVTRAVGDSVEVVATVDEFNYLTELINVSDFTVLNSGNTLPDPVELTTLEANSESYEGVLINVTGAVCMSGSNGDFVVDDGSGVLTVYKSLYSGLSLTIDKIYDITGVMTWYNSGSKFEILPRSASDVNAYPEITGITLNPTAPTTADDVVVTATLTDVETTAETMEGALYWGTTEGSEDTEVDFLQEGFTSVFNGTIPASTSSTIYYVIEAYDGALVTELAGSYSITTGINDPSGFVTMNIYPNPSNGQFTLELNAQKAGTFNVEIVNIAGQVIYQKQIEQDGMYKDQINIGEKAKGMYYIRISDGTSVKVQKLMIQ